MTAPQGAPREAGRERRKELEWLWAKAYGAERDAATILGNAQGEHRFRVANLAAIEAEIAALPPHPTPEDPT